MSMKKNPDKRTKLPASLLQHRDSHSGMLTMGRNLQTCSTRCNTHTNTSQHTHHLSTCVLFKMCAESFHCFPKEVYIKPASTRTRMLVSGIRNGPGWSLEVRVDERLPTQPRIPTPSTVLPAKGSPPHLEPDHMGDLHPVEEALDLGDPAASSDGLDREGGKQWLSELT